MDVIVKSKNCDVSERLREDAVQRLEHAARFYDRLLGVEMVFSQEQNPRIPHPAVVEVTARTKGHHIRAEGAAEDHRRAVDAAMGKFERQLSRYKARLIDRNRRPGKPQASGTTPQRTGREARARAAVAPDADTEPEPRIVRTKRFELVPMVPEDAALQLELLGHDFYLFRNASTGECSLLYRRKDGDLGLIEAIG